MLKRLLPGFAVAAGILLAAGSASAAHPNLRAAVRAIQAAIDDMQRAPNDFGGHKLEAINACRAAINQIEAAIRFDR